MGKHYQPPRLPVLLSLQARSVLEAYRSGIVRLPTAAVVEALKALAGVPPVTLEGRRSFVKTDDFVGDIEELAGEFNKEEGK